MNKKTIFYTISVFVLIVISIIGLKLFSEESQNKISRAFSTTLGMKNGCVEVYFGHVTAGKRFLNVEKFSTAIGTDDGNARPYRYGYGYNDINLNGILDISEKKIGKDYFEVSEYSQYIYFVKNDIKKNN